MSKENSATAKRSYAAPVLIFYGSVTELTQGQKVGNFTDKAFPRGTPKPDITFS